MRLAVLILAAIGCSGGGAGPFPPDREQAKMHAVLDELCGPGNWEEVRWAPVRPMVRMHGEWLEYRAAMLHELGDGPQTEDIRASLDDPPPLGCAIRFRSGGAFVELVLEVDEDGELVPHTRPEMDGWARWREDFPEW